MNENTKQCKHIAETLEAYASGEMYRCPECGEELRWIDEQYNDEEGEYTCQNCGATFEENALEPLFLHDFLTDIYNIEFRVSGKDTDEINSVQIMVACGGPNIYIDTASKQVELYWWTESAHFPISYDAVEAVNEWAEEYWNCM